MSCTSVQASRLPADQLPVDYAGVQFWCHVVVDQGMVPNPTVPKPAAVAACGGDRLAAAGMGVPYGTPTTTTLQALASIQHPPGLISGVTGDRYVVAGRLTSIRRTAAGLAVVLRGTRGQKLTALVPSSACGAVGSSGVSARVGHARSALEKACGVRPTGTTIAVGGNATVAGLGVWRSVTSGRSRFELTAVTGFSSRNCAPRG